MNLESHGQLFNVRAQRDFQADHGVDYGSLDFRPLRFISVSTDGKRLLDPVSLFACDALLPFERTAKCGFNGLLFF